jgi:hypothetical protein
VRIPSLNICWLKKFLNDRHFVVKIGTAISQISKFQTGAPQGDVLSPFLFSLFINDIPIMHKKK